MASMMELRISPRPENITANSHGFPLLHPMYVRNNHSEAAFDRNQIQRVEATRLITGNKTCTHPVHHHSYVQLRSRIGDPGEVMTEEIKLIQAVPVVRDDEGMFYHPDMPDFDEGEGERCRVWIAEQGLEVKMVELEYHSDESISERYFEAGEADCSYWDPDRPDGDGWFCLSIHDSDDGPVCWWARRVVTP